MDLQSQIEEYIKKVEVLRSKVKSGEKQYLEEYRKARQKLKELGKKYIQSLTPWEKTQLARHPKRPHTSDYIKGIFTDFVELHGDRKFGDDKAIIGGFGFLDGKPVCIIGHEKGRDTKEKIERNFGMPHPEGYRKAIRLMKMAEKFKRPVITFIDTPGAYPGIGAEERGQSQAIAESIATMADLKVPTIAVVIGEGGSGGALALGVGNRVLMLENSIYSVISPEGCAAILYKTQEKAPVAAENLKITAKDLLELGIIDEIIPEPCGGAHLQPEKTLKIVKRYIKKHLKQLENLSPDELIAQRESKFYSMGRFAER